MPAESRTVTEPLEQRAVERLRSVTTATLATVLYLHGFRSRTMRGVSRLSSGQNMVGVARTLRYIAGREDLDNLPNWIRDDNPQRRIADEINPGEVAVIEAREDSSCGTMGGMLVARMMRRGAAGIVSDGPFRDGPFIAGLDFASYASGMNANTNLIAHHPEDLDVAITCGGVQVRPGDAIVGDEESVVVIPRHLVDQVAEQAFTKEQEEAFIERRILDGAPISGNYPMNEETRRAYEKWAAGSREHVGQKHGGQEKGGQE